MNLDRPSPRRCVEPSPQAEPARPTLGAASPRTAARRRARLACLLVPALAGLLGAPVAPRARADDPPAPGSPDKATESESLSRRQAEVQARVQELSTRMRSLADELERMKFAHEAKLLRAGLEHLRYGDRVYEYSIRTHERLTDYRFEQQGQILQDWWSMNGNIFVPAELRERYAKVIYASISA